MLKHISTFFLFSCFLLNSVFSGAQTVPGSGEYMDEVSANFDKIKIKTWDYLSVVSQNRGAFLVESTRQSLLNELLDAKEETQLAPNFNGKDEFRLALVTYFDQCYTILSQDYEKVLEMEASSSNNFEKMEAYLTAKEKGNEKLDQAYFALIKAQTLFAQENKLIIHRAENDLMAKKIERTGQILSYYNKVYLTLFRVYKQEAKMLVALKNDDVPSLEWSNKELKFEATVALESLQSLRPFEDDSTLKIMALQNLQFYFKEATEDAQLVAEFYEKKKNYEQGKIEFEKIPKENLTQADADKINAIGRAFNQSVQDFQLLIKSRNQVRIEKMEAWNKSVEAFFKNHQM